LNQNLLKANATIVIAINPNGCEPPITAIAFRRLESMPPKKSAVPQVKLESKASSAAIQALYLIALKHIFQPS
jgi:hypothetical protein